MYKDYGGQEGLCKMQCMMALHCMLLFYLAVLLQRDAVQHIIGREGILQQFSRFVTEIIFKRIWIIGIWKLHKFSDIR